MILFGKFSHDFQHLFPRLHRDLQPSKLQPTQTGGFSHIIAQVRFISHFGGVVDEVSGIVAEPASLAVLHHLLPAAAIINNKHTAASHGFKAHARPVLRGVRRLEHDATMLVERLLRNLALIVGDLNPVERTTYLCLTALIEAEEKPMLEDG